MNSESIQNGILRQYLLRMLSDKDAEAIEERYFNDAKFFKELRAAEMKLICDHLEGRLNEHERRQFESRYLHVDTLRKLVEGVRARRLAVRHAARRRLLHLALAGAMGCAAILGVAIFGYNRTKTASTPVQSASVASPPAAIRLGLAPGIIKGPGSTLPEFTLPDPPQIVSLAAELPGQMSSAAYTARILNVDLEGTHKNVWTARAIQSTPRTGGQQVIVELPSASISPGDYILELEIESGRIRETYLFRVKPSLKEKENRR